MRKPANVLLILVMTALCTSVFAASTNAPFPDTKAGAVAREWVNAFPSEPAMRAFLVRNLTAEALKKRSLDERLKTYRELKKKYVALSFDAVVSSTPYELEVSMLCRGDGERRVFTFTVEAQAPNKLKSITIAENHSHGFFSH